MSTIHSALRVLAIVLGISIASQASAKYFHHSAEPQFRIVKVDYTPQADISVRSLLNTAAPGYSGFMRVPVMPTAPTTLRAFGGDHDGNGGGDDSTGNDDSTGGGDHDGDTTGGGDHGGGDHDGDTTGGGDTSVSPHGGHGDNDTIDCGHHGDRSDNDDSTNVNDSNAHAMFSGGHQSIIVKSHGQKVNITVAFTNNLTTSVTVSSMKLQVGSNFTIVSGAPTKPMKLAAGAHINVVIAFTASDLKLHTDQLQIVSNSTQPSSVIALQGVKVTPTATVATLPTGVAVTMTPNPMTTNLKFDLTGVSNASVAIYNLTGREVYSANVASSEWFWNGTSNDGAALLSGTYIVRLVGMSTDGTPFSANQKVIVQH